jgi:signal transduction histidine kinase
MEILHTTPIREEVEAAEAPALPQPEDTERKLASHMTHELRAPLTSIRSALGILLMQLGERLAPEERQILQMAVRNSERLDSLINDIMDFSKIRAGKMSVEPAAADPRELIQEAIESLRSWATAKGVRLVRAETDEPAPRVFADRRRTVQVLINLLSNAIKFTPSGGKVEVSAVLGRFDHAGAVLFKVKDTGPGIPAADIERVFRSFEQSALGRKSSQGTGLGLTLAKAMVELQDGRIWAESWKGLGATFLFTLPIHTGETRPVKLYPEPVRYHGLLTSIYKRLNSVVAALFA